MKKTVALLFPVVAFAEPERVYEPPKVMKFEIYALAGKPEKGDYHLKGGFDWRTGYPFLAGLFYEKEKGLDGMGGRAKVRVPLFWKVKNDFGLGAAYEKRSEKKGSFFVEMEQVVFLKGSFSLRISESYYFGSSEVKRWVISAGFGF